MLTEQSRFREKAARISTHLYLSLSDCSSTRIFKRTHTYRNIWTTANQRGGVRPSLSLIGLDHDMSLTCLLLNSRAEAVLTLRDMMTSDAQTLLAHGTMLRDAIGTCHYAPCRGVAMGQARQAIAWGPVF